MSQKLSALLGVALLLVASGCVGGAKPADADPSGTSAASTPASQTTASPPTTAPPPPPPPPVLPVANITADIQEGPVPLEVAFNLTDAAGSPLSYFWTLDFGDGNGTSGSSLPAAANHSFEAVGNYTVNFTVTAGDEVSQASVDIVAKLGRVVVQYEEGDWVVGASHGCVMSATDGADMFVPDYPLAGQNLVEFDVAAAASEKDYRVEFSGVDDPEVYVYLSFHDADGTTLGDNGAAAITVLSGTVPEGSVLAVIAPCNAGAGSYVFEAGLNLGLPETA